MSTPSAITTVGSAVCRQLVSSEMLDPRTTMAAFAIDPDLIDKVCFLQEVLFLL
jgi:hypothetical protein